MRWRVAYFQAIDLSAQLMSTTLTTLCTSLACSSSELCSCSDSCRWARSTSSKAVWVFWSISTYEQTAHMTAIVLINTLTQLSWIILATVWFLTLTLLQSIITLWHTSSVNDGRLSCGNDGGAIVQPRSSSWTTKYSNITADGRSWGTSLKTVSSIEKIDPQIFNIGNILQQLSCYALNKTWSKPFTAQAYRSSGL